MLKGRKQKYSERWPKKIMNAMVPVLMSTPVAPRLKKLTAEIKCEHNTRRKQSTQERSI